MAITKAFTPPGVSWKGTWAAVTVYKVNDAVYYMGSSYRRVVAGATASNPEVDATNWTLIARGTVPTGWQAMSLNTGITWYSALGHAPPQWRRDGDYIYLRGAITRTGGFGVSGSYVPFLYDSAWGPVPQYSTTVPLQGGSNAVARLSFWGTAYASSPGIWEMLNGGTASSWMALDAARFYWPAAAS